MSCFLSTAHTGGYARHKALEIMKSEKKKMEIIKNVCNR